MNIPTKAEWDKTKSDAGISRTPWYKPADAAVGPAIGAVDSARAKWKAKKDYDSAAGYMLALGKLHAAFDKFIDKKKVAETGPLGVKIVGWMKEVSDKFLKLQGKLPALQKSWNVDGLRAIKDIGPFMD